MITHVIKYDIEMNAIECCVLSMYSLHVGLEDPPPPPISYEREKSGDKNS